MVKPGEYSDTFKLAHLQKTVDVTYCTTGWLKRVKEHPTIKSAYTLLAESKKYVLYFVRLFHQNSSSYFLRPFCPALPHNSFPFYFEMFSFLF